MHRQSCRRSRVSRIPMQPLCSRPRLTVLMTARIVSCTRALASSRLTVTIHFHRSNATTTLRSSVAHVPRVPFRRVPSFILSIYRYDCWLLTEMQIDVTAGSWIEVVILLHVRAMHAFHPWPSIIEFIKQDNSTRDVHRQRINKARREKRNSTNVSILCNTGPIDQRRPRLIEKGCVQVLRHTLTRRVKGLVYIPARRLCTATL